MQMQTQPWWMTDEYFSATPIPAEFEQHAGPHGIALVKAWQDGRTSRGWGLKPTEKSPGFMKSYESNTFRSDIVTFGYESGRWSFAFVMRSLRMVCIDIDGKNGGLVEARKLGMLPYTLAETSKSGDGFHLFYLTSDDQWDSETGFAMFNDRIALEQGVDLRSVGCVYHYKQQRWNNRALAELPQHLKDRLNRDKQRSSGTTDEIIKILDAGDPTEVAMMHDTMITDLNKQIPAGRRNTTLFAIGSQMMQAQIPGWPRLVHDRALALGLDIEEADKLLHNIKKYGD
jgi:hypothetical protein